ncbi:hypothetical protein AKJ64_04520 [candidate division MSBL1 archaeon SCGC-AAA259E17]|uniref:Metalloenzyme domain-containing protein n=1 Tax=candidate division MSBL1 archaeon SCGC-AAA259E17 TaxID=1698263 RepID=A0A133UCC0_9EURY|nr:hypothetical protein AKJ64_04520 [candidate division MSBL1 archaeon SCGC-AAA259E17]
MNSKLHISTFVDDITKINLRKVLRKVAALVEKIDREVIVTSDHGQLLDEKHVPEAPTDRDPPQKIKTLIEVLVRSEIGNPAIHIA